MAKNKGSDHSHSRFDVGSGYYGETRTNTGNGGGQGTTKVNMPPSQQASQKAGSNFFNPVTTGLNIVGSLTGRAGLGFVFDAGKKVVQGVQKATRTQTAKGETIFGNTKPGNKGMPITRDYYRTAGKPLDVISPEGTQYMKDAGFLKNKGYVENNGGGNQQLCPDGTYPPCKKPVTQIKQPVTKPNNFLSGFQSYDDGGEVVISDNVDKDLL